MLSPSKYPLEYNPLSYAFLTHFYTLSEGHIFDALQLHHYGFLDDLHTFKTGSFDDPLELGEKKKSHTENREVVPVEWCFFRPGTAGCSAHPFLLLFRHAQIFGGNLPKIVFFNVQLTCNHLNSQPLSPDTTCLTHSTLTSVLLVEDLLLQESSFTLLVTSFAPLLPLKNTCVQHVVISIHLRKHFKCLWRSFLQPTKNFGFIHSSKLNNDSKKRKCKQKYGKNAMVADC